jgi:hypothetical protein
MALILSGDTGPSFVQAAAMPTGAVVQTVRSASVTTAAVDTTSTTWTEISTGLRTTITPTSASNKILVQFFGHFIAVSGAFGAYAIYRSVNGGAYSQVNVGNGNEAFRNSSASTIFTQSTLMVYDEPATTSQCIYTLYFRNSNNSSLVRFNDNPMGSFGIAQEIKV